jgi:HlyD family secretion protein
VRSASRSWTCWRPARAWHAQTRAARHQAELNLQYTDIVSPIDGVVISRNVDVGQTVAAAFQAPTLFVVAEDLAKMQVDTSVAEADVGRLQAGMEARFTVDAFPGEVFRGTVRQIRNAAQTIQNVVTYDAVIDVANPALRLRPGMTANVTFAYATRARAVLVPNAALRFRPADAPVERAVPGSDRRVVWTLVEGRPQPVTIRAGVSDGVQTEVLDGGLRPGQPVITDATAPRKGGPGSFGRVL